MDAGLDAMGHLVRPQDLAEDAVALARRWLDEAAAHPVDRSAELLAGVLSDPHGLEFTVGFVDGVVRPEDLRSAARKLRELTAITPSFLPRHVRAAVGLGGWASTGMPHVVVPVARRVLRAMVGHLILDASDPALGRAIAKIRKDGVRLNVNLLGEAILGDREAERRLAGTVRLLQRTDVDYVSIKVSSTVAPHSRWGFDEAVTRAEEQLVPLFRMASETGPPTFINLDMEEYRDIDLTFAVFTRILDRPEFDRLEAGIALQAYLPDALAAMMRLQEWAARRVRAGGAPIKVRVVKGANLPMEMVDAAIRGWPLATWGSKQQTDTSYKAVLDYALTPERVRSVRIGIAGHNLFDVALAWLLAKARGAEAGIEVEMLRGMATGQAQAVRREVGSLRLYTPVVQPAEFDVAIAYLIRRLEEGASQENFVSAVFEMADDAGLFEREKRRFFASLAGLEALTADGRAEHYRVPTPNRRQDRRATTAGNIDVDAVEARVDALTSGGPSAFANTPDTDPDLPGNRAWGRGIADRMVGSTLGRQLADGLVISDAASLDETIARGVRAGATWQALGVEGRTRILHRAGEYLEARRDQLLEVMGSECGKTLDQGDPEVSEAIDFAHYYAGLGQALTRVDGATYQSVALTAVISPWNFPTAIPAGGILAALAAGSAVVFKPASASARTGAVLAEALWDAGVPRDVLQYVRITSREIGSRLVADERVGRVILTGSYETAAAFREARPDLPLLAETSGKNAIIVTPDADLDLAVRDIVGSAFGHAGQKCSAASLVVLVGSVATSKRFKRQLVDAVRSLKVGTPDRLDTQMGPVIAAPSGKLLRGLTTLGPGESWLVEPHPADRCRPVARLKATGLHHRCDAGPLSYDDDGNAKLWTPGVREGVARGSEFHLTEYFGPILGIMTAATLDEAIGIVNDVDYGLTSGLHSLDRAEIARWLDRIEAGNLYVNRGTTGAIVRRQPFGGWKKSAVGTGTKAGGPNYLHALVDWADAPVTRTRWMPRPAAAPLLAAAERAGLGAEERDWLAAALSSDARAWDEEFGVARDVSQLGVELNILRYLSVPVVIRLTADAPLRDGLRAVSAGLAAQASPVVSTPVELPNPVVEALRASGVVLDYEDDAAWRRRLAALAEVEGPHAGARVRIVAGESREGAVRAAYEATQGRPDIAVYGGVVVSAGRVEMLPYLREQAVSITAHRFGAPNRLLDGII